MSTCAEYDNLLNAKEDVSLYNYFKEISYNKLNIVSNNSPSSDDNSTLFFLDSHNRDYYLSCPEIQLQFILLN